MKPIIFLAFANDRVDYVRYLRNLPLELAEIRKTLQIAQQNGLCEVVERANCTIEDIFDVFQTYEVAVFHYGGHADGYQFLLEQADGTQARAAAEGIVPFLASQKHLKLAFFNGCSTEQQSLELSEKGVPAVIGTLSEINDEIAKNLAVRFYKGLAQNLSIEKAWQDAENQILTQYGKDTKAYYRPKKNENPPAHLPHKIFCTNPKNLAWQLNSQRNYKLGNINKLLMSAFDDESLTAFCQFNFEKVHNNFANGQSKQQKAMALLDHGKRFLEMEKLLDLLREENEGQYEQFKPYY